ncbi:TonB-dependent receptor [Flavobacterium salilacus subsp. salilacus]|uniref:TonB-dependent receptor n=1 Tax=Flavobacterium TaxID=237 RepID=UPI0010757AA0|nr:MULTISPECIES: TonB-dependent receptor [Flavobacterium]KAF2520096.1 TonB-dependent receptor [Flavobacterium salilacus subsp. salilacus]MBE1613988.1 TonB-dependent receptor [Flavobacterium sp. SaA2.13]
MRIKFLLISLFIFTLGFSQNTATITGTVTDKDMNNETLPFASVAIKGTNIGTNTDENGKYTLKVPAGSHTLVFGFLGYENIEVPVTIAAGETKTINKAMSSTSVQLQDVVIEQQINREKESALLVEQKKAVEIKQSIGAQELSRKATTTVEQGLTKISGITNVKDRGIFVRGLDDRYNYLLINGLPVASPDPDKKIIPLNYISTSIVESIDVFKTFNSNLYQDFAGATFQINTRKTPSKSTTVLSYGVGYNTNTTFNDFYTDDAGSGFQNFAGYTGNSREIPNVYSKDNRLAYSATPEESANLFETSWTPKKTNAPLNTKFGISHGQRIKEWDKGNLGVFLSLNYNNSYLFQSGQERRLSSEGNAQQDFESKQYDFSTQKSGLFALNYKIYDKLDLTFNTIYLQNSSNTIAEGLGLNNSYTQLNETPFFIRDTKYTENRVAVFQVLGDYEWMNKKHVLHFGTSYSDGKNNVPDRRVLVTADSGENAEYITTNGINPFKFYQELDNSNINALVEYKLGFDHNEENDRYQSNIRIGYNADLIDYEFFNRTISASFDGTPDQTIINTNDPEAFFQNGFANGFLRYRNTPDPTMDSYINQLINASYINYTKQWEKLLIEAGIRAEYAVREIEYRLQTDNIFSPHRVEKYDPFDLSPALNIKYNLNDDTNLRFAASKTTTRPRLREILPTVYQGGDGNQTVGNRLLENSTNYNVDLKYEVFPSNSEVLAIAAFGKLIQNPIERIFRSTSVGYLESFGNFDEAYLYGIELEGKLNIGSVFKADALNDFSLGFNGILMQSESKTDNESGEFGQVTNKNRDLQGASNWGINADISYQLKRGENFNSTFTLIFNTYGKRIYAVGVEGADDIYEKPINQLDLVWNTEFNDHWGLRFTIQNILDEETLFTQDATREIQFPDRYSNIYESYNLGVNFGLTLTYKL